MFDALDYFLISAFFGSLLNKYLYPHLHEENEVRRLKEDMINQCTSDSRREAGKMILLKQDIERQSPPSLSPNSKIIRPISIWRGLLDKRGGDLKSTPSPLVEKVFLTLGTMVKKKILKFLGFLALQSFYAAKDGDVTKKFFIDQLRLFLEAVLKSYKIEIYYLLCMYLDSVNIVSPEMIAVAIFSGGAPRFLAPWIPIVKDIFVPSFFLLAFITKSFVEAIIEKIHDFFYERGINKFRREIRPMTNFLPEEGNNLNPFKVPDLEWETERDWYKWKPKEPIKVPNELDVFESQTFINGDLHLDPFNLNPELERKLEDLDIREEIKPRISSPRPRRSRKGKTVNFRDFIGASQNDLEVIDAEIVSDFDEMQKKIDGIVEKIRIKDD